MRKHAIFGIAALMLALAVWASVLGSGADAARSNGFYVSAAELVSASSPPRTRLVIFPTGTANRRRPWRPRRRGSGLPDRGLSSEAPGRPIVFHHAVTHRLDPPRRVNLPNSPMERKRAR